MAPVVPVAKFFALAAKQLAKPVSQILTRYTLTHPGAKSRIVEVGQVLNRLNLQISRLAEGQKLNKQILAISDEKALEAGATFLGEVFVFSVGAVALLSEILRSQKKAKELEAQQDWEATNKELQLKAEQYELKRRLGVLETAIVELRAANNSLSERVKTIK